MLHPVAPRIFAMLPVEGQRGWPYFEKRLLLLNVVGSKPLYFAKPEQVMLCACANRSIVFQMSLCVIFFISFDCCYCGLLVPCIYYKIGFLFFFNAKTILMCV